VEGESLSRWRRIEDPDELGWTWLAEFIVPLPGTFLILWIFMASMALPEELLDTCIIPSMVLFSISLAVFHVHFTQSLQRMTDPPRPALVIGLIWAFALVLALILFLIDWLGRTQEGDWSFSIDRILWKLSLIAGSLLLFTIVVLPLDHYIRSRGLWRWYEPKVEAKETERFENDWQKRLE
jgi:hypothetical protein